MFPINVARLHPILVHLPIGILIITLLLEILKRKYKGEGYEKAIEIGLLASLASAVLTIATGLLLAEQGTYPDDLTIHKWFGISTGILTLILYLGHTNKVPLFKRLNVYLVPLTLIAVTATGHLGGSLTHGPDYLFTKPLAEASNREDGIDGVSNSHIVEIKQFKFIPATIKAKRGDTITFINKDFMPHDVTETTTKQWSSSILNAGDSWSMVVKEDADYFCSLHIVMKGKIELIR